MLLLLHGEEPFLRARKLQDIKERYRTMHAQKFYVRVFDCAQAGTQEVLQEIRGASLFQEKKLIVLDNPFSSQDATRELVECKDELARTSQILVFSQEGSVDEKNPLFLFLKEHGKAQKFSLLSGGRLQSWISQEFLRYGIKISIEVQEALAEAAGNDLWRLSNEIAKLAAYSKGAALTKHDVEELVEPIVEPEIFATIDAIAARNTKQALALLAEHEKHGDPPLRILSTIGFQFRALLAVKEMADMRLSYNDIVRKTKLHPFVVTKAWEASKNFSLGELKKWFRRIFDIELGLKTGSMESSRALSWFVLGK
ncbi:MAG: DNA polymerase III subunit delta [Candidatus Wildermuthbacteria bacterium RIFCSPHIGHO2_02_FULL_47_12]|uniref:DNA polymerase III subunit delta n=1 Tax=Candidatus Wildermuthbacteria bacterium RIFCSPHIGHO2_02_FULL_47_12 TaxID=1802451 RepID=A0A1G2R1G0_9BACT|nr:MAG: DNA polymerase III subunit delta [Candidatus Wildermuthbacteria bacterium RIFCSPHIGHO2_02_FULL_47_12]